MKIDFGYVICDLKGLPIKDGEKVLTLGQVAVTAMFAQIPDDQNATADQKVRQFKIAQLAADDKMADISTEDAATLKQRIAKVYNALVVGRAFEAIEGGLHAPMSSDGLGGINVPGPAELRPYPRASRS